MSDDVIVHTHAYENHLVVELQPDGVDYPTDSRMVKQDREQVRDLRDKLNEWLEGFSEETVFFLDCQGYQDEDCEWFAEAPTEEKSLEVRDRHEGEAGHHVTISEEPVESSDKSGGGD